MPPEVSSAEDVSLLSGKIADQHGFVTSGDQTRLFYRHWPASSAWNGRTVVVLHGIGYHSAPYRVIADALNPQGTDVYGLDARGHGLSQGRRGYVGTSIEVGADVECMIRFVQAEHPGAKIFLLGDSMGADLALNYAKRNSRELSGLILLALALNLDFRQFLSLESLSLMPYFALAHREPVISLVANVLKKVRATRSSLPAAAWTRWLTRTSASGICSMCSASSLAGGGRSRLACMRLRC